ncbi:MAG: diacylglycerol kinase [Burkholderiaceae bacterium]
MANSLSGFRLGWAEPAFRQEVGVALFAVPAAFWLGRSWAETALLIAVLALVLITELLNTGIEAAIDRVGPEWHAQAKRAKDVASAAVLISLLLCGGVWLAALWSRWA